MSTRKFGKDILDRVLKRASLEEYTPVLTHRLLIRCPLDFCAFGASAQGRRWLAPVALSRHASGQALLRQLGVSTTITAGR